MERLKINNNKLKIVAICGSLRKKSYNKAAILAAKDLLPENIDLEIADISNIPFFNEDIENTEIPEIYKFKTLLDEADAILIATPEYNYSVPAVLKNALDWASRGEVTPLFGKPLAIMSVSISSFGGLRAQYHLRQICVILNMLPINKETFIPSAMDKFDEKGLLVDERAKKSIKILLDSLVEYTLKLK